MRHTQAIILAAVLLAGIVSGGCTRIHSAEELTKDTRPETTPVFTDAPKLEFSADGVDPYANVIAYYVEQYQKDLESDDMLQPFTYVLYDMDKDGTPELIVRTGYSEADYALYVWTADADKQPVQVEGCGNGAHTQIYGSETELGFFINSCHMDTEYIAQDYLTEGNSLEEVQIYAYQMENEAQSAYGYYDLTAGEGFFRLDEQSIEDYRYKASPQVKDAKTAVDILKVDAEADAPLAGIHFRMFTSKELDEAGGTVDQLDKEVLLRQVKNLFPLKQELEEMVQEAGNTTARERAAEQQAQKENLTVVELHAKDFTTEVVEYKKNNALYEKEAMDFVDTLSEEELIDLAAGDPGKAQGGNLGAAGISVPGSAGETHRCAIDKGLASIVLADGPAGLRLMKYYHVNEGSIVTMPFEFSLEGGLFYDDSRELPGERYYQYCTAIPVGTLLAQTWDEKLIREVGAMIGTEMEHFGVTLWLAPGMNIHRNPLCGRNFEYYSEDPYVAGTIAAAMTEGVQSNYGCGTTIKHFACNNQEDNRMGSDSVVSERTLRELYLKGFEIAVKESQPMSIMTSYNLINGVHAANNYDLCTDAARNEWGFKGMIMTDWTTTEIDEKCTASGCMRAGNDLVMPGCFGDHDNMRKALAEGTLKIEDLKACIARLVGVIWKSNQYLQ